MRRSFYTLAVILRQVSLACILSVPVTVQAQHFLTGTVSDADSGNGLPDVVVRHDTSITFTSQDGSFKIAVGDTTGILYISRIGYLPQNVHYRDLNTDLGINLSPDPLQLDQVVVSAGLIDQSARDFPGMLGVIHRSDFARGQDVSIMPALNRIPGVHMQTGALNTNRITIRGMGARSPFATNRVKAYYGQIPLTTGDGETTIEDLDLSFIDRVEVIKGPNASLYGSGLGGTIRLIPAGVRDEDVVQASHMAGSYGLHRSAINATFGNAYKGMLLGFTRTASNGYRENNRYERLNVNVVGNLTLDRHHLMALVQMISLDAQIPSSIDYATFQVTPRAAAANWKAVEGDEDYTRYLVGLGHRSTFGSLAAQTAVFATVQTQDERRPFNVLGDERNTFGLRSVWSAGIGSLTYAFGLEMLTERYNWSTFQTLSVGSGMLLSDNEESRSHANVFVQGELSLSDKWKVTGGVNLNRTRFVLDDKYTADGDISGTRNFSPVISPRVALSFQPNESVGMYLSSTHGFSTPSLEETLAPDGDINPDINPEYGWNIELGAKGSSATGFTWQAAVYHMPVKDLLVARRTAQDAFIGINAGRTIHNGLEVELRKTWITASDNNYTLFVTHLETDYFFDEFVDNSMDFGGNALTGTPARTQSGGFDMILNRGFSAYLNYLYAGRMPMNDANSLYTSDYLVCNVQLGYRIVFGAWELHPVFGVNNVLDRKYSSMIQINAVGFGGADPRYYYPGLPRNVYGQLSVRYTGFK